MKKYKFIKEVETCMKYVVTYPVNDLPVKEEFMSRNELEEFFRLWLPDNIRKCEIEYIESLDPEDFIREVTH